MKCKARQGNAKRDELGILAENTAVLAGDFKINFGHQVLLGLLDGHLRARESYESLSLCVSLVFKLLDFP